MANRRLTSARVVARIGATVQNIMDDGNAGAGAVNLVVDETVENGVSAGQATRGWQWIDTADNAKQIAAGGTLTIDVFDFAGLDMGGGDGQDIAGQQMDILEVVAIMIKNANDKGSAGILEIIPAPGGTGWTPIGSHTAATGGGLRAQGVLLKYQPDSQGFAVTDGSNHRIQLTANGGNVDLAIAILGRHDVEESSSSSSSSSSVSSSSSSSSESSSSSSSSVSSSSVSSSSISTSSSSSISTSSSSSVSSSSISSSSASSVSSASSSSVSSSSSLSSGSSSSASSIS